MLIWVLQSSHCFKIRLAQHCGRRGANVSENEGVRSECKKFGENSRQMAPVSTICDEYCSFHVHDSSRHSRSKSWDPLVSAAYSHRMRGERLARNSPSLSQTSRGQSEEEICDLHFPRNDEICCLSKILHKHCF